MDIITFDFEWVFERIDNLMNAFEPIVYKPGLYSVNNRYPLEHHNGLYYELTKTPVDLNDNIIVDENYGGVVDGKGNLIAAYRQLVNGLVNTRPFLSIRACEIFINFLDGYQVDVNPFRELLFINKIYPEGSGSFLTVTENIDNESDVLFMRLKHLDSNTKDIITNLMYDLLNDYIASFIKEVPDALYTYTANGKLFTVVRHENIVTIRYKEALALQEHNKQDDDLEEFNRTLESYNKELENLNSYKIKVYKDKFVNENYHQIIQSKFEV